MSSCKTERPKAKALVYLDARTAGQGPLMTAMTKARKRQRQGQRQRQIPFGDDNQRGKGKSESNSDGKSNGKGRDNGNDKGKMRGFFASLRMTRIYLTQTFAGVLAITIF
jgi:hypothetical protein